MQDTIRKLYGVTGRANRLRYWQIVLSLWAGFVVPAIFVMATGGALQLVFEILIGVSVLVLVPAAICVSIRRLHDRDRSGWWLLPFAVLPSLCDGVEKALDNGGGSTGLLFSLVGAVFGLWGFVEMGCLKGTDGPNRFGGDPLGPPLEVEAFN